MQAKAMLGSFNKEHLHYLKGVGTPILVMAALAMVVLPLPAFLLDILFSFNIALALIVMLVVIYTKKPTEFGSFP
ncbi:MAG: flagellar biosynthesis protein FlhA, partial [Alteromonadaceae bacterium]